MLVPDRFLVQVPDRYVVLVPYMCLVLSRVYQQHVVQSYVLGWLVNLIPHIYNHPHFASVQLPLLAKTMMLSQLWHCSFKYE